MKLLVVDDHVGVRRGLRVMLELNTGIEVTGDVGNGREALESMREELPDVVIMDARMPVMDGVEATRAIKEKWPEVCVVAFSSTGDLRRVAPMIDAGAGGCLLKGQPPEAVLASIRQCLGPGRRASSPAAGR